MKRKLQANLLIILLFMLSSGNAGAVSFDQIGKVDIHGFISQGYMKSSKNNCFAMTDERGSSQFNEIGINFATDVSDRLRFGLQFLSRDLGKMGNHEVTIDWAVADYSVNAWLDICAGKMKLSHGLYNTERDVDFLRANIFLPQSNYYEGWRDSINAISGIGAFGYIPLNTFGNLTYNINGGNVSLRNDGGESRTLMTEIPRQLDAQITNVNTILTYNTALSIDTIGGIDGLKIAGSFLRHEFDSDCTLSDGTYSPTFDANMTQIGIISSKMNSTINLKMSSSTASLEYSHGNTVFAAEYEDTAYNIHVPVSSNIESNGMMLSKFHSVGYYAGLTHRFNDSFQIGAYYSEYYPDKDDKDGYKAAHTILGYDSENQPITLIPKGQEFSQWLKDACIGFRFDITPNWIMKIETHYMDGAALLFNDDNNTNSLGEINYERYWMLYMAKMSINF